jgi:hypothetical protein
MNLTEIFADIKNAFGGLWQTKQRGDSLEIITPYATTNNKFVSVFLSKQGKDFVISDGGWLYSGIYEVTVSEEVCFLKILYHFQNSFEIKQIASPEGITYYYLKTANSIDIPSKLFDLTLFIQNIVSVSEIAFDDKEEKETKERFVSVANEYLKSFTEKNKLHLNSYLIPDKKDIKFNAIYNNSPSILSLVNYVTGSSNFYFSNSISKANMLFQMATNSYLNTNIKSKISIIDTSADGYALDKLASYLSHLEHHTGSVLVNWSEKERLQSILK